MAFKSRELVVYITDLKRYLKYIIVEKPAVM